MTKLRYFIHVPAIFTRNTSSWLLVNIGTIQEKILHVTEMDILWGLDYQYRESSTKNMYSNYNQIEDY